jgi:fructose-bisphosphate aldolase class II
VLAAAVREGYQGPVFIQGDHFQLVRKNYLADAKPETDYVKGLIKEAIEAEFCNIDIDTSTIVDIDKETIKEQQRPNFSMTAELAGYIRGIQPGGIEVSIGGEIGEIGKKNNTPDELRAYLEGFRETFKTGKGISKLSVQTGTSHGGVVMPCPKRRFTCSPRPGHRKCISLPDSRISSTTVRHCLRSRKDAYTFMSQECAKDKKEAYAEEQFIYSTRKKGFGPIKKKWWNRNVMKRKREKNIFPSLCLHQGGKPMKEIVSCTAIASQKGGDDTMLYLSIAVPVQLAQWALIVLILSML